MSLPKFLSHQHFVRSFFGFRNKANVVEVARFNIIVL